MFASSENSKLLAMLAPKDCNRRIYCTIECSFGRDPGDFLDDRDVNLALFDTRIEYKSIQSWHTKDNIYLMYTSTEVPTKFIAEDAWKMLINYEKAL